MHPLIDGVVLHFSCLAFQVRSRCVLLEGCTDAAMRQTESPRRTLSPGHTRTTMTHLLNIEYPKAKIFLMESFLNGVPYILDRQEVLESVR